MYIYRLVLALAIGIFLFSTAIIEWWVSYGKEWYQPWLLWLVTVIAGFFLQPRRDVDEL